MWSPQPTLGGALWSGNASLATTRQLLSTSSGLASTINTNNTYISSLSISTGTLRAGFAHIDQVSTGNITGSGYLGSLLIGDPDDGGIVQIASKFEVRNTVVGPTGEFIIDATKTTIGWGAGGISFNGSPWAPINPVGTFTSLTAPVAYIDGLSSLTVSTGQLRTGTSAFDSISSLRISTGSAYIATSAIDSISSLRISTGTAHVGVANIGTLTVGAVTLSGNLDMCNNNISNVATLTATTVNAGTVGATAGNFTTLSGTLTGNVNGNLTGNVTGNISNANLTVLGQYSITETADVGSAISNYANYGTVNITGKGGLGGIVNITADVATPLNPAVTVSQLTAEAKGNYGLITPVPAPDFFGYIPRGGLVSIIARQGLTPSPPAIVTSQLFGNGQIVLEAYSYNLGPGLIQLISGANAMYAGAITPLTGIYGNNYVFGQYGNSILAGLPPGGVPNVPGENYIYGLTGTVIDNGLYTDTIYNKFGGNLNLDGRASNIIITASNIGGSISLNSPVITLTGSTAINLTGSPTISGNLDMTDGNINNVAIMSGRSGSNLLIQNTDHFINFPPPGITYATGGTITESGGRTFHTFTADGTFTILVSVGTVEVMGIGGGGGGGGLSGGGGGAGNFVVVESALAVGSYTVTVGPGGAGGTASVGGTAGSQSRFSATGINIRMLGGGGGSTEGFIAGNGGCGGGGSAGTESAGGTAGTGVTTGMTSLSNVAFAGGSNPGPGNPGPAGSGGGGTASIGLGVSAISPAEGGDGGTATLYYGTYYGGGGGGSAAPSGAYGAPQKGRGGGTAPPTSGGNGSLGATSTQAQPGVANTGGGGGGGEDATAGFAGAAGGSGIVIVSYDTPVLPQFTIGTLHEIFFSTSTVLVENDLFVGGTTNITTTNVDNINSITITNTGTASFDGPSTIVTGQLLGQNNKPIAIVTGVATGFWNPSGSVGTVTASGAASFSNADNPSGFAVADFNAYMSLLSFNNLNATDFYLSDQRIQQNSAGTYWSADCDAIAYNPNVYLSNQNVQWIVNGLFIPKSLS